MRYLLLSNGLMLAVIGGMYLFFGDRPSGLIVGGILCGAALGLWAALPLTDPYRYDGGTSL